MNLEQFNLVTDRISPQTTWGHEDANRIGRAINYMQTADSADATDYCSGAYALEQSWEIATVPISDRIYYQLLFEGQSGAIGGSVVTGRASSGAVPTSIGFYRYEYDGKKTLTISSDQPIAFRFIKFVSGSKTWSSQASTDWALNDIPTWADMEVYLYRPYLETLKYFSVDAAEVLGDTWAELPFDVYYANTLEKLLEQAAHNFNFTDELFTGTAYTGQFMR